MKTSSRRWIALMSLASILVIPPLKADEARDQLAEVVRQMGYGAGIHNFKNYLLRGRPEYHADARANFTRALEIITGLEQNAEFSSAEQREIVAVKAVLDSYNEALDRVAELHKKGWRIEDIDSAVNIDDAAAIKALDTLRAKWNWSDLEQIEFHLGYGRAIHHFKDYVLRGKERYHTAALEDFLAAESLLGSQLGKPEFSSPQAAARALATDKGWVDHASFSSSDEAVAEIERLFRDDRTALENVERTAHAYREHLGLIERLIAMQRSVRQIDLAVKINDGPAKAAFVHLRGRDARMAAGLERP